MLCASIQRGAKNRPTTTSTLAARKSLCHDLDELFVVEPPVPVQVCLGHEVRELVLGQGLAQGGGDGNDLLGLDVAGPVLVEDPESLPEVLQR